MINFGTLWEMNMFIVRYSSQVKVSKEINANRMKHLLKKAKNAGYESYTFSIILRGMQKSKLQSAGVSYLPHTYSTTLFID